MRFKNLRLIWLICLLVFIQGYSAAQALERIEPEFTTSDRLMKLSAGMSKEQVLRALEVYPYEILYNTEEKCEVQIYKVAIGQRSHFRVEDKEGTRDQLDVGIPYYDVLQEVYVYFKDGALDVFFMKDTEREIYGILAFENALSEACNPSTPNIEIFENYDRDNATMIVEIQPIEGCMDEQSLNYNPLAQVDDGSCEYCDCGFEPATLTEKEKLSNCPPCLPSQQLWNFWIADGRCDLIRRWVEAYPPLFERVPRNYFSTADCKPVQSEGEECDWCDLLNQGDFKISNIELENK